MDKNNYSFTSYYIDANGDISYTVTTLDEDRRDRRMTKAEILKQIEELKQQVEALPDDEKKIRTLPVEDKKYIYISSTNLCLYESNYPVVFDNYQTKENSSIGNYFKSKEDAEMVVKAMQIEQAIRIRRIELNEGWEPDWDNRGEGKYFIFTEGGCHLNRFKVNLYNHFPILGYYKSVEIAQQIIDEFKDDLLWYFNEYYPNKDKMYVWGETEND